jgi:hypothetical protein
MSFLDNDLSRDLWETALVVAGVFMLIFWIIPNQTISDPNLSIQPSFLPTLCAIAIGGLSVLKLIGQCLTKAKACEAAEEMKPVPARWWPVVVLSVHMALVTIIMRYAGVVAGVLATIPIMMFMFGERRLIVIAAITACVAVPIGILF